MSLKIVEKDFNSFFEVPFNTYPKDSHFVSPFKADIQRFLDPSKNPLFRSPEDINFFTAVRNGKPVGRIISHIHRASNERHKLKQSFFGFFECENNQETANALFTAAENFGRKHGMNEILGNMNMTAMQQMGVMTGGFEHPVYIDMVYSPEFYPSLMERAGYSKYFPMTTHEMKLSDYKPGSLITERSQEAMKKAEIRISDLPKSKILEALQNARLVLNAGFDKNPFFVPVTEAEFNFQAKDLSLVIDPRITSFAYQGDRAVGVLICIPDLNPLIRNCGSKYGLSTPFHFLKYRMNRTRAVVIYYSVVPELHGNGIAPHLMDHTLTSLQNAGYKSIGFTWIADENKASLRQMEKIHSHPRHRLHMFKKALL